MIKMHHFLFIKELDILQNSDAIKKTRNMWKMFEGFSVIYLLFIFDLEAYIALYILQTFKI